MPTRTEPCDLLCVAAHTDDAEIALGGTLRLLADRGRRVWVCDLTRGELATNATVDERWREAGRASRVLGLVGRVQLSLPDGFLAASDRAQLADLAWIVRRLQPRWVVAAPEPVRHPDHRATPALVERACYLAGLVAWSPPLPEARWWPDVPAVVAESVWRPEAIFTVCDEQAVPRVIFDVSTTWTRKREALACYASQFTRTPDRRPTYVNDPAFHARLEARARLWGHRAGVEYGEALAGEAIGVLDDLPTGRWS